MAPKKEPDLWVIFAGPRQRGGPSHYIAADGSVTASLDKAEKFYSYGGAAEFAKAKSITLDGVMRYAERL
jgi:hypothetical protein